MRTYTTLFTYLSFGFLLPAQIDSLVLRPDGTNGKDGLIWSFHPNSNHATNDEALWAAWTNGGNPSNKRFFIEFNMSSIPAGTTIDSAFLFIYHNPTANNHGGFHTGAGNSFFVRRVTSTWTENGLTWNNQPSVTSSNQVTVQATTSGTQDFKINVTALTKDMLNNNNYGYCLRLVSETTYKAIVSASSDHSDPNVRPMLKVYYNSCILPEAGFSTTLTNNTVYFTDTTNSSTAHSWLWDFGDGSFSSLQNPIKTYSNPGVYNVCLALEDSCGVDTVCQQVVLCTAPQAGIQYSINGATILFQGQPNNALSYYWDFGDGNFTTQQNPQYTYSFGGSYQVCLSVTDSCGSDTNCTTVVIPNISVDEDPIQKFNLFPNPNNGAFTFETENSTIDGKIEIYDLKGNILFEKKMLHQNSIKLDLKLAKGVYVFKLVTAIENRLFKFIVE